MYPIKKSHFHKIFDTYYQALCHYAFRFLNDDAMVEDVVQDAFVYVWENEQEFTDDVSLKVFLYRTVKNKCLNLIKHEKVKNKLLQNSIEEIENAFESDLIKEETIRYFYQAIENLPEKSKAVILLSLKGMKNEEIASQLSVSVNTVKTHKKEAYRKLRFQLSDVMPAALLLLKLVS